MGPPSQPIPIDPRTGLPLQVGTVPVPPQGPSNQDRAFGSIRGAFGGK